MPDGNAKKSPEDNAKKNPYLTTIVPKRQVENVTFVTPASMTSKEQVMQKKVPVSKGQQVQNVMSVPTESNKQENKEKGNVKLDIFEKAFGGTMLCNQLSSLDVDDEYNFVQKNNKDYDNLKYKLKRVRLQSYFPQVVKEGFDIYNMICEILPGNTVANLRSNLCTFLHDNRVF